MKIEEQVFECIALITPWIALIMCFMTDLTF